LTVGERHRRDPSGHVDRLVAHQFGRTLEVDVAPRVGTGDGRLLAEDGEEIDAPGR